jgi:hypothetical protein
MAALKRYGTAGLDWIGMEWRRRRQKIKDFKDAVYFAQSS